ncbi:MAG TPA: DMT family transporter [Gaiellaceae bacterium]|nr:DMT family transporter [Gaiellaceae bacterium]
MTGRRAGILLAFATACISGVAIWVNSKAGVHFADATVYTTAKDSVAGVLLCVLAVSWPRRNAQPTPSDKLSQSRKRLVGLATIAVIGGSVPFVLFFEGLARAEATQASFLQKTLVIWVVLLAVPLLREKVRWPHYLAIALLIGGQVWLVPALGTVKFGEGEAMILGATLLWSVEVIVVKKLLAGMSPRTLAAARMGLGTALLFGWLGVDGKMGTFTSLDWTQWRWALLTGLILTAYVGTWYAALSLAGAIDVTAVLVFGAVVTAALSGAFDGASVNAGGIALIALGTLLTAALALRRGPIEVLGT